MIIHSAQLSDAAALAELHATTVGIAYKGIFPADAPAPTAAGLIDAWRRELADPRGEVHVARHDDMVVGSVACGPDDSVPAGYSLRRLHVHPDHQGQGLGSVLHDRVLASATSAKVARLQLWVLEANERARRMYERRGWVLVPGPTFANDPPHIVDVLYERAIATS